MPWLAWDKNRQEKKATLTVKFQASTVLSKPVLVNNVLH